MEHVSEEQWRFVRDATTPPDVLETLINSLLQADGEFNWNSEWRSFGDALAAHPNLPLYDLGHLAVLFPAGFCRNPVLPLLLLEHPGFVVELASHGLGLIELMRHAEVPEMLLRLLRERVRNREMLTEIELHVGLSGEATESEWRGLAWELFVERAQRLRRVDHQLFLDMIEMGLAPESLARPGTIGAAFPPEPRRVPPPSDARAADPNTGTDILLRLAREGDRGDACALARNPGVSEAVLEVLLRRWWPRWPYEERRLMRLIACHPRAEKTIFFLLAGYDDPVVRRIVRRRADRLPEGQDIRQRALAETLERNDDVPEFLRCFFLMHPDYFPNSWESIVQRGSWWACLGVVLNPTIPDVMPSLLAELTEDGNRLVRAAARARLRGETVTLDSLSTPAI